jgi:hypothetical protein
MTIQVSEGLENARLDAVETYIGVLPILILRSGTPPADVAAADTGTLLAFIPLPSDWMNAAASRAKTLAGSWSGVGVAPGTIGHFRIIGGPGSPATPQLQGTVTATGGGGDMTVDNVSVAEGQVVNVTTFTLRGATANA